MKKTVLVVSGAVLAVLGIVGIVVGALLPNIVEDQIISAMEERLPRDVEDEEIVCKPDCEVSTKNQNFYVFNITNAQDVLKGVKPIVTQTEIEFTVESIDYDMDYKEADDSIGYHSWSKYVPKTEGAYDMEFITLNPVYFAIAVGAAGSEKNFQTAVVPGVFATLATSLTTIEQSLPVLSVYAHVGGILNTCGAIPADCVTAFNGNQAALPVSVQLTLTGLKQDQETEDNAQYGTDIALDASGFSLPAPVNGDFLVKCLLNITSPLTLLTQSGNSLWVSALQVYPLTDKTELYRILGEATAIAIQDGVVLDPADAETVLQYLGKATQDPTFIAAILSSVLVFGNVLSLREDPPALRFAEKVNSWKDLVYSQFGSGSLLGPGRTFGAFGGLPAFEFYAHQATDASTRMTLTMAQSEALVLQFQQDGSGSQFCALAAAVGVGGYPLDDFVTAYADIGATAANLAVYAQYICTYIPETFFMPTLGLSDIKDDGTAGNGGTGMFVRKTLREILHGSDDFFFTVLGQAQAWNGLLGKVPADTAEAKANDAAASKTDMKTRRKAGNEKLAEIEHFVEVDGLSKFATIEDLGGDCANTVIYTTGLASECKMWTSEQVIAGLPDTRWPPLNEDTPVDEFEFYVSDLKRSILVENSEEVELHKIRMIRYLIKESETLTVADVKAANGDKKAVERAEKYVTGISGFLDLTRSNKMTPIHIGFPRHNTNDDEAAKIAGVTPADWSAKGEYLTSFDVEPLTGVMMAAHKRLQYNIVVRKSQINGFHRDMYTGGDEDDSYVVFPLLWFDEFDAISEEDAVKVNEAIFDVRDTMGTLSTVGIIISVVNCVAGAALVFLGMRPDSGQQLQDHA